MAEQVVDIRQRIERMRTQIDENSSTDVDTSKEKPVPQAKVLKEELNNKKEIVRETIPEEKKKNEEIEKYDLKKVDNFEDKIKSQQEKKPNINQNKTDFTQNYFRKIEKFENKQKKSFSDYQLKNTTDNNSKKVDFEKGDKSFPQFSLNINNPISWKLMLLIMLMQLLTNIMLVVVLYFK
tara:strand:+ start:255 stop:794 length:540 start_codon:yes stop_codon:yes gene_type:complete